MRKTFQKNIPAEKHFHIEGGMSFGTVEELYNNLDKIDEHIFNRHLYNGDFAKWVRDVFLDTDAFNQIVWAKSKKEFKEVLKKLLYQENSPNSQNLNMAHKPDPDVGKEIGEIVEEDKKHLSMEKSESENEKSEFHKKQLDYLMNKGEKELALKDYQSAANTFEQAESLYPENELAKKKMQEAIELLKKASKKDDEKYEQSEAREKEFSDKIEALKVKYEELRERIKNARKSGKDPYIAELHMINYKAKVDIAKATHEEKDIKVIKDLLLLCEKEVTEAENEKIIDVFEEIEEGSKKMIDDDLKKERI